MEEEMDNIYAIIPVSKFSNAKTRLSPFLSLEERENLLKAMLSDVTDALKDNVDEIYIISSDEEVLEYAHNMDLKTIVEVENPEEKSLNNALKQAMDEVKDKVQKVIILPSDVPLIGKSNIGMFIEQTQLMHFVIVPSKGGGTNALLISPNSIEMKFGDFSFIKHVKQADLHKFTPIVHDSFYMAMDVNTTEDLGEIIIHGDGTKTKEYLQSLNIHVRSVHGPERLVVERD